MTNLTDNFEHRKMSREIISKDRRIMCNYTFDPSDFESPVKASITLVPKTFRIQCKSAEDMCKTLNSILCKLDDICCTLEVSNEKK